MGPSYCRPRCQRLAARLHAAVALASRACARASHVGGPYDCERVGCMLRAHQPFVVPVEAPASHTNNRLAIVATHEHSPRAPARPVAKHALLGSAHGCGRVVPPVHRRATR
eukprot:494629-Alexandrium_andersonii.AAC.1